MNAEAMMTSTLSDEATAFALSPHVTVLTDRCAGCQECVIRCPTSALSMDADRWVAIADDDLCVGCRQCVRTCPFSAITVAGPQLVTARVDPMPEVVENLHGDTREVVQGLRTWDDALAAASRCLDCPDATCVLGCPAHNDIPSFIRAISDHDLAAAHDILRRTSVLPDVCSRVCDQAAQCEGACSWSLAGGQPVAIGALERFVTDQVPVPPPHRGSQRAQGMSVAVIGSGPAAIAAAWELVDSGARVTVYEKAGRPGGLLDWGIPDFTLPADVADRPWQQLTNIGVELHCGVEIQAADIPGLLEGNDAVILANGASVPLRLTVPGSDLDGVTDATTFLKAGKAALAELDPGAHFRCSYRLTPVREGASASLHVLVLGAGNTAMDVARTARRLGFAATCIDWVDERFALARADELEAARDEDVQIMFLRTVTRFEGDDARVRRAVLATTKQARSTVLPKVRRGKPDFLDVDLVVMAMGYRTDAAFGAAVPGIPTRRTASGLPDRRWLASGILARSRKDHDSLPVGRWATEREVGLVAASRPVLDRLWAVGDALVGAATVVEAMAHGKAAAAAVITAHPSRYT
jgi:glutamate synthase (NADPH/NADH) small chain